MRKDVTRARIGSTLRALAATAMAGAVMLGATSAMADDWKKRGHYYAPAPYYAKVPRGHVHYYAPAPVYYAPPPMVVYPAPVAYAPAYPVYPAYPGGSLSLGLSVPLR